MKPEAPSILKSAPTPIQVLSFIMLVFFSFVPIEIGVNCSQIGLLIFCALVLADALLQGRYLVRLRLVKMLPVLVMACIAACQLVGIHSSPATEKNYVTPILFVASLVIGSIVKNLADSMGMDAVVERVRTIIPLLVGFFSLECITRYVLSPYAHVEEGAGFYAFKSSLFYFDSNFVGIAILCLIAIMLALPTVTSNKTVATTYGLLFATISRASIISALIQFALYKSGRLRRWLVALLVIAQPIVIYQMFGQYVSQGGNNIREIDGSFSSKFYLLQQMSTTFSEASFTQKLFGIGVGNSENLIGIFAHNIVVTFVLELGIVGSALLIVYIWLLSKGSSSAVQLLLVPVLINGFALVSASMPYFFAALGLLGSIKGDIPVRRRAGTGSTTGPFHRLWGRPSEHQHASN